jgi:hypothetical protein
MLTDHSWAWYMNDSDVMIADGGDLGSWTDWN